MTRRCGFLLGAVLLVAGWGAAAAAADSPGVILIGPGAPPMEQYAARELQRYLYQLSGRLPAIETAKQDAPLAGPAFLIGRTADHPLIARLATEGKIKLSPGDPGPQGYVLKTVPAGENPVLAIVGATRWAVSTASTDCWRTTTGSASTSAATCCRSGRPPWGWRVEQRKTPAVAIRGFLPWTNFPQSATSYSWQDWRFIIDQMAKMRMNFLHIHNYNGGNLHNGMFHNFTLHGLTSRVWMATARSGHRWSMPGWDVSKYRFGAGDLFDDYDYGADCACTTRRSPTWRSFARGRVSFRK